MGCVNPDGRPTQMGIEILRSLQAGGRSPEEVASQKYLPLFRVRSGLRELAEAGYAQQEGEFYTLAPKGKELVGASS